MVALVRAGRKPEDNRVSPRNRPARPGFVPAPRYNLLRLMLLSVLSRKRMAS